MIVNHSASIYSLGFCAKYNMIDFNVVKEHKKTGCIYSYWESNSTNRIYVDTELSVNFRHEICIDDKFVILELKEIFTPTDTFGKYKDYKYSVNLNINALVLENNEYHEYSISIMQAENERDTTQRMTQNYKIETGLKQFNRYKDEMINAILSVHAGRELTHKQKMTMGIYKGGLLRECF